MGPQIGTFNLQLHLLVSHVVCLFIGWSSDCFDDEIVAA
jgi:hypothetical protein